MSCGDQREDMFLDDVDRHDFIKTLAEACQKTDWQIHCFCLHLNPVPARLLAAEERLLAYPWSSSPLYLTARERKPDWPSRNRDSVMECGYPLLVLCRFNALRPHALTSGTPAVINPRAAGQGSTTLDPRRQSARGLEDWRTPRPGGNPIGPPAIATASWSAAVLCRFNALRPHALTSGTPAVINPRPAGHGGTTLDPRRQSARGLAHSTTWRKSDWPSRNRDSVMECGCPLAL